VVRSRGRKLAVLGVDDGAVRDRHALDDVVGAAADRADRDTVSTRAVTVGEDDVRAGVDS
jgi:endonuclease V-like protein UPF0215 family